MYVNWLILGMDHFSPGQYTRMKALWPLRTEFTGVFEKSFDPLESGDYESDEEEGTGDDDGEESTEVETVETGDIDWFPIPGIE
jgi:hypothetical protein